MKRNFMVLLTVVAVICGMLTGAATVSAQEGQNPLATLNLTQEQIGALEGVIKEAVAKQEKNMADIRSRALELKAELTRPDRFDTESKEKASVKTVNRLVRDIVALFGKTLRTRVEYLLKAKNVLTLEQKQVLLSHLEFEVQPPGDFSAYMEADFLDLPLELDVDQMKRLITIKRDMQIKQIKLETEISLKLLDLETELMGDEVNPRRVDKLILSLTDTGIDLMENRVDYFLKSKDVLTLPQKKELLSLISMGAMFR